MVSGHNEDKKSHDNNISDIIFYKHKGNQYIFKKAFKSGKYLFSFQFIIVPVLILLLCESTSPLWRKILSPLETVLVIRILEIIFFIRWIDFLPNGFHDLGFAETRLHVGIKKGLSWSAGLGGIVSIMAIFLAGAGYDPMQLITCPIPSGPIQKILFFVTAGLISPVAEEIFFRGFLYSYFRKYGLLIALFLSSLLFSAAHFRHNTIPIVQLTGGVVFCLSFEYSKSIASPIIIHISGNLAIFTLSLINGSLPVCG